MILDANFRDNSVMLFTKLGWLPIDDIIRTRKLSLLHKIYNDRISSKCKKNSGLRSFLSSATRLWNKTEPSLRHTLLQKRFLTDLQRKTACVRKLIM